LRVLFPALWKWGKSLLVIISLELATAISIRTIFLSGGILTSSLIFILIFFVREALITLRALYSRMRVVGTVYKRAILW